MNIYRQVPARKNLFPYCNVFLFPNSKLGRSNTEANLLWLAYNVRCDLGNLLGWGRVSSAERGAVGAGTADWRAGLQRPLWAANGEIFVLGAISSCLFILYFYSIYIFLQLFAWPPFENNNLLLSDRPSATFCPFSAPFEEFLMNLEEALVVLGAWLLKLVLTDSAGKMWTAFSVALGSSSGQWLSEGSTRDHWSDLEEHVFLRKQHNN